MITLRNNELRVVVDPGRGCDILSIVEVRTDSDILFTTPWRSHADAIRAGQRPVSVEPIAGWLEAYRGGWQTLCPTAGDPHRINDAPVGYHGEVSVATWTVDTQAPDVLRLHVDLFSVPVRVERVIRLVGASIEVVDRVSNLSDVTVAIDFAYHPAFGGALIDGSVTIESGARSFTSDAGTTTRWPAGEDKSGTVIDLSTVDEAANHGVYGWLDDFDDRWVRISNTTSGLAVLLEWGGDHLCYAWIWEELGFTETFPWYGRARVIAVEPATMPTTRSGSGSGSIELGPREACKLSLRMTLER